MRLKYHLYIIDACEPNPCNSGGTCLKDAKGGYSCDCTKTGFVGRLCHIGRSLTY